MSSYRESLFGTQDYAELFDITASTHELNPETGKLQLKQEPGSSTRYGEIVLGTFPLVYGYEDDRIQSLVQQVDNDVREMLQALEIGSPEDFA